MDRSGDGIQLDHREDGDRGGPDLRCFRALLMDFVVKTDRLVWHIFIFWFLFDEFAGFFRFRPPKNPGQNGTEAAGLRPTHVLHLGWRCRNRNCFPCTCGCGTASWSKWWVSYHRILVKIYENQREAVKYWIVFKVEYICLSCIWRWSVCKGLPIKNCEGLLCSHSEGIFLKRSLCYLALGRLFSFASCISFTADYPHSVFDSLTCRYFCCFFYIFLQNGKYKPLSSKETNSPKNVNNISEQLPSKICETKHEQSQKKLFPQKHEKWKRWNTVPSLKLTARTWKWMVGILLSYWGGLFSDAMLVSGRVNPSVFLQKYHFKVCLEHWIHPTCIWDLDTRVKVEGDQWMTVSFSKQLAKSGQSKDILRDVYQYYMNVDVYVLEVYLAGPVLHAVLGC